MAIELRMLQMDQTMTKGKIGKWLVNEGDTVTQGQPLLEIETDKVVHEQESPTDGVIAQLLAEEGANVPVNALLAIIGAPGEEVARVEVDAGTLAPSSASNCAITPSVGDSCSWTTLSLSLIHISEPTRPY